MDNFQLSELAQKAKNGDMVAFEKLYIELSPEIYAIACEITQNKEESRDLVQDCFLAAMENIATLKEPDKIKNWLIRIAANKSRDYIKKKKPSALTEDQYEIIDNIEDEDISVIPEASLETEERIEEVNEILGCLTEEKRLCLLLRFKYDMSYAEIAQELGITESAVKSRISRAKDDIEKEAEKRKKKGLPLFGIAPFGLVIFALKRSAEISAATFAGSAAQTAAFAGVTAISQAGIAAASTAATVTATSTTATAATGIGAKVAAMSVAQKVVAGVAAATIATGSATVTTVVVKNKIEANTTTTAYVEEVTTAPDYGFESETVFIPPVTEISTSKFLTIENLTSSVKQSSTVTQIKETEKSTVANKTITESTTKNNTTTQKQTTTTTTKVQTTATTKATTTKKETTTEEVTTAKPTTTTTRAVTTTKATTTTTTKATTKAATTTTTEASSPATVTVTLHTSGSEETTQKILSFEVGESITDSVIEQRLMSDYGIDAMSDSISETAESGKRYTVDAFIIS